MKRLNHLFHVFFVKPVLEIYLKRDSKIRFDGFSIKVLKGVFHPMLFFSTKYFYSFISNLSLENLKVLEIGSGSGLLSMLCVRKKAQVTAIDIDEKAVENTRLNMEINFLNPQATVLQSDVFSKLQVQAFDVIIINPPYYFKKVDVSGHYAWYCGENGEYFERLFSEMTNYIHKSSSVYMILEEKSEIERIKSIGLKHGFSFSLADKRQVKWEWNYIFSILKTS